MQGPLKIQTCYPLIREVIVVINNNYLKLKQKKYGLYTFYIYDIVQSTANKNFIVELRKFTFFVFFFDKKKKDITA